MDIKTILQDERKKKFLIIGLVAFLVIIGIIFFLLRTPATPQANNDQLLSDLAKLAPRDVLLATDRTIAPIINVSSDATTVAPGQPAVISWNSDNATSCADGSGNELNLTGSLSISPKENYTLDVVCTNPKGTTLESVTVAVTTSPIIALSAYPNPVKSGDQSLISWNTTNTTRCVDSTGKTLRLSGSFSVVINKAYTFEMSCTGPNGAGKNLVTVAIASPQAKIIATKTTITTAPNTATTITTATKTNTNTSRSPGSLSVTISKTHVKYDEASVISWEATNIKTGSCTGTTSTGIKLLDQDGNVILILMPLYSPLDGPLPLPDKGNMIMKVISGKQSAKITIRCENTDGTFTEETRTVTSDLPPVDMCIKTPRAKFLSFTPRGPITINKGTTVDIQWEANACATDCFAISSNGGKSITYPTQEEIDNAPLQGSDIDLNTYTPIPDSKIGVNPFGGLRVGAGKITVDCVNMKDTVINPTTGLPRHAGTTNSIDISYPPEPAGCSGWFKCNIRKIIAVIVVGVIIYTTGGAAGGAAGGAFPIGTAI